MEDMNDPLHYRTIWISDVHLGTRECRAEALLDFLRTHESETLYLVGDVFDGVRLRRSWFWAQLHNDVVQKLLRKARKGTRVLFLPGNHDAFARAYLGHRFGGIEVAADAIHETADGRRLWVVHGDRFDPVESGQSRLRPLAHGVAWVLSRLGVPAAWRLFRPLLGRPYRSLATYVKERANDAMAALIDFERTATREARRRGADGVVCGHTHVPRTRTIDGTLYLNDGDWVSSCTALVEHFDGRLELLRPASPAERSRVPQVRTYPSAV
jgi:UDP-2,3-diacylglucosamine pyrophosphatase LpxH